MSQAFWDSFYANLFASLSVVLILGVVGFLAKHRLVRTIKKFIASEVDDTLKQIQGTKKDA